MKRRSFIAYASLLGAAFLSGCSGVNSAPQDKQAISPFAALVETRSNATPSCIHWLDEKFEEIGYTEINHAYLSGWNPPSAHNGLLYLAPIGLTGKNDARSLVTVDTANGAVKEYPLETVNNYCVTAADGFAFVANNLNWQSHLTRVDLADASTKSVSLGAYIADSIIAANDVLLAFSWNPDPSNEGSKLTVFDFDLNPLSEVSLTEYGSGIERPRVLDGLVYFVPWTPNPSAGEKRGQVGIFDISANELQVIDVVEEVVDAVPTNAGLALIHGDIHVNSATTANVSLLNYGSWEQIDETRVPFATYQTESTSSDLVILDASNNLHKVAVGGSWEEKATSTVDFKYSDSHFSSITLT